MQNRSAQTAQEIPLDIVGGANFGRWPQISSENVVNMFSADGFSINFAGYQYRIPLLGNGRGFFVSTKSGLMFAVSSSTAYKITSNLGAVPIFSLQTDSTDVFIDEDLANNVAFCDGTNIHIYNYVTEQVYIAGSDVSGSGGVITQLDFVPNYVVFHNGRFLATSARLHQASAIATGIGAGNLNVGQWRLSDIKQSSGQSYVVFQSNAQRQGGFQTKPDLPVGIVRLPGRQNQIIVLGSISGQQWTNYGLALFPYQLNTTFNFDFGCLNAATIATLSNITIWLGKNESSGVVIMYTTGQDIQKISTDGIDKRLENLSSPEKCYAFTYMQSGHLFYVFTFYGEEDNFTLAYDFSTGKFQTLMDERFNFFIAKKIVLFNNKYYFISINDGNIYEINSGFTTYNYKPSANDDGIREIPRARITKTFRTPDDAPHVFNDLWFVIEQGIDEQNTGQGNYVDTLTIEDAGSGYTEASILIEGDGNGAYATLTLEDGEITAVELEDKGVGYTWAVATVIGDGTGGSLSTTLKVNDYVPRVDLSVSYDGGYTWSNYDQMQMTRLGRFRSRFYYNGLGQGNEITLQFRYHCKSRFLCSDGKMSYY